MSIIEQMLEAAEQLRHLPKPVNEIRMHPADIEDMRRQCGATKIIGPVNSWSGIKIIPDVDAPRLPRRQA